MIQDFTVANWLSPSPPPLRAIGRDHPEEVPTLFKFMFPFLKGNYIGHVRNRKKNKIVFARKGLTFEYEFSALYLQLYSLNL